MAGFQDINALMQLGGGTEAEWNLTSVPVPAKVLAYAVDTKIFKMGDGVTLFVNLPVYLDLNDILAVKEFKDNFPVIDAAAAGSVLVINADGTGYALSDIKLDELVVMDTLTTLLATKADATHGHNTSEVSGLGTAALRDTGVAAGDIPVLGVDGKFDEGIVPTVYADSIEQDDIISYLLVAQLADDDAAKLNLPNGFADTFETEEMIDLAETVNAVFEIDKYSGSDITLVSKATGLQVSPAVARLYFTCETTAITNAEVLAEVTRDDGANWSSVILEKSGMSNDPNNILIGNCNFDKTFQEADVDISAPTIEDVKGDITALTVDTENESGRFDNPISPSYVGFMITTPAGTAIITNIEGNGTAEDSVSFAGTLALGAHVVNSITGLEYKDNKLAPVQLPEGAGDATEWDAVIGGKPGQLRMHAMVAVGTDIYVSGGVSHDGNTAYKNLYKYDTIEKEWSELASMPIVLYYHSMVEFENKLYVFGGEGSTNKHNNLWVYDIATDTWSEKQDGASPRVGHSADVVGRKMYVFGGVGEASPYADMWSYDFDANTWTQLSSSSGAKYGHISASYGDKIYVSGGYNEAYLKALWRYDTTNDTWKQLEGCPIARHLAASVIHADEIFMFGGTDGQSKSEAYKYSISKDEWFYVANEERRRQVAAVNINGIAYLYGGNDTIDGVTFEDLVTYDIESGQWQDMGYSAKKRWSHTLSYVGGKLYMFGGRDNTTTYGGFECFDPATKRWSKLSAGAPVRYEHTATVVGTKIYIIGGRKLGTTSIYNDIWEYDTVTDTWIQLAEMPAPRQAHITGVVANKLYVIFGKNGSGDFTSNMLTYDIAGNSWAQTTLSGAPGTRTYSQCVSYNDKIWILGGVGSTNPVDDFYEFDPVGNVWTSRTPVTTPRYGASLTVAGDKMYVIGGHGGSGVSHIGDMHAYDLVGHSWEVIEAGTIPYGALSTGGACDDESTIYIFGGVADSSNMAEEPNHVDAYDIAGNSWSTVSETYPGDLVGATMVTINDKIYMYGGVEPGSPATYIGNMREYDPATDTWTEKTPCSQVSAYHKAVVLDGKMWIQGGFDGSNYWNTLWAYDPVADSWESKEAGYACYGHSMFVWDGKIYTYGGWNGSSVDNTIREYDPDLNNWTTFMNGLNPARYNHTSTIIGNMSYHFGGHNGITELNDLQIVNMETKAVENRTISGYPVHGHETYTQGSKLIVVGGYDSASSSAREMVISIDLENSDRQEIVSTLPRGLRHFATTECLGKTYIFGGMTEEAIDDFYVIDSLTSPWEADDNGSDAGPAARHTATVTVGNKMYLQGGIVIDPSSVYMKDLWALDLDTRQWTRLSDCPGEARYDHAIAHVDGKLYIYGGTATPSTYMNDMWEYDIATDTWKSITVAHNVDGLNRFAMVGHNGKVYIHGGVNSSGQTKDLYSYDPSTDTWMQLTSGGTDRRNHTMVGIGDALYIHAGYDGSYLRDTWKYNILGDSWASQAPGDSDLAVHAATVHDGKMYIYGGNNGVNRTDVLKVFDPEFGGTGGWTSTPNIALGPEPVQQHGMGMYNDHLYVYGGYLVSAEYITDLSVYNIAGDVWEKLLNTTTLGRHGVASTTFNDEVYIFGGENPSGALDDFIKYNPVTGKVTELSNTPPTRQLGTLVTIGTKLYLFGGINGATIYDDVWEYDTALDTWTSKGNSSASKRYGHVAVEINGKMYIHGGYYSAAINDTYEYDPSTNVWTQRSTGPARYYHTAVAYGGKMYVVEGHDGAGIANDMYAYDPSTNTWSANMPGREAVGGTAAYVSASTVLRDKMYLFSGYTGSAIVPDVWEYTFANSTWRKIINGAIGRNYGVVTGIDDTLYVMCGSGYTYTHRHSVYSLKFGATIETIPASTAIVNFGATDVNIIYSTDSGLSAILTALRIGIEYKVFKNGAWRSIARDNGGTWEYQNSANQWIAASVNAAANALTEAMVYPENQMTFEDLQVVKATELSAISITELALQLNNTELSTVKAGSTVDTAVPEGTNLRYRIRTINGKEITIKDMRIKWS